MKRTIQLFCVLAVIFTAIPPVTVAEAIDPITIAVLAPIAIRIAKDATPYVLRGMKNGGLCLLKMCKDTCEVLLIPWGLGVMCCGRLRSGLKYTIRGCIAPAKLLVHTLIFPVSFFGVNFNLF